MVIKRDLMVLFNAIQIGSLQVVVRNTDCKLSMV